MKKILLSLGSILFAGALLAGGTGAFLQDSETSTGNTFASGVIDLKVDNESYVTNDFGKLIFSSTTSWSLSSLPGKLFFNFLDVKPGDVGEDTVSLHVNNNNAYACMNVVLTSTPENGQNDPEAIVDPTTGLNDGELQNNLSFVFWADDGDNVFENGEKVFKEGTPQDIFNGENWALSDATANVWGTPGPIIGNSVKYIGKAWCFGDVAKTPLSQDGQGKTGNNGPLVRGTGFSCSGVDTGNIVQSDGLKADINFSVVQSRSNSGFTCANGSTEVPPVISLSTLFADDFSSCVRGKEFNKIDNSKWDQFGGVEGEDWSDSYGKLAFLDAGSNPKKPDHTESMTSVNINTTGYGSIKLSYDRNMDVPWNKPATLTVDYSTNGGNSWTVLEAFGVDSNWTHKEWSLAGAENKTNVKVRFTFVGTDGTDHAYIDNVIVTGSTL